MFILRNILFPLQQEFNHRCKGDERGVWFVYTLLAVITHFTSSRSANLLRCLQVYCSDCRLVSADSIICRDCAAAHLPKIALLPLRYPCRSCLPHRCLIRIMPGGVSNPSSGNCFWLI